MTTPNRRVRRIHRNHWKKLIAPIFVALAFFLDPIDAASQGTAQPAPQTPANVQAGGASVPQAGQTVGISPQTSNQAQSPACPPTGVIERGIETLPGLAWPLLGLLVVLLVAFNRRVGRSLGLLPRFVQKIKGPGGIEIEINADAAKAVRANFRASFEEFVAQTKDEYERMADARSVREVLRDIVRSALPEVLAANGVTFNSDSVRATIHVDDIVFRSYFYQLVEYFPPTQGGGRAGRRFSQRYGIIGQSWRLSESLGKGMAVSGMGGPSASGQRAQAIRELIKQWGMTEEEATIASRERPATLSVLLRHDGRPHGLLYIDSSHQDAFGNDTTAAPGSPTPAEKVARALEAHDVTRRLARAVAEVLEPLRAAAPFLEVGK